MQGFAWKGFVMNRQTVSSSNLAAVGYDPVQQVLEIEFHGSGLYQYSNVPVSIYQGLMNAPSHGKYFHRHIKTSYSYTKI